ncbi:hypothetical protein CPB97_000717 [Podila verticillata]|nr:hypothetical protein CPB97_000717 [Podila verticillata]
MGPHTFDWLFDRLSPCRCLRELKIWRERSEDLDGLALDLSFKLANGLAKLSNLRQLRKLDFEHPLLIKDHQEAPFMDLEDVQWMVEHWPRLGEIRDLVREITNPASVRWLNKHRPHILLPRGKTPIMQFSSKWGVAPEEIVVKEDATEN